jgi:hypothetical protein
MQPSYTAGAAAGGGARMAGSANHRNATPSQWLNDDMQPRPSHTHAAGDGPDAAHFVEEKVEATHACRNIQGEVIIHVWRLSHILT